MRLSLIIFTLLCSPTLVAQEFVAEPDGESSDEMDTYVEDLYTEEAPTRDIEESTVTTVETDKIHVECVCPDNQAGGQMQEEFDYQYLPSIFAPGTAVTIMPTPDPSVPTKVEILEKQYPPGFIEQLPSGYSNDGYKPIGTFEKENP